MTTSQALCGFCGDPIFPNPTTPTDGQYYFCSALHKAFFQTETPQPPAFPVTGKPKITERP